jgi:hypothetical protein
MNLKMNKFIAAISCIIFMSACHRTGMRTEKTISSAIPVTVSSLHRGPISSYLELSATSAFLFKASVKTPVTGYIENMLISQGDAIENNRLLFTIKTKEASALVDDSLNSLKFSGIVDVKSGLAGLISTIDHPKGDYVTEGDQLCQIAVPESFVFILDVPFELSGSLKLNTRCEVILPDGRPVQGVINSRLPSMASSSQTERFIVKLLKPINLPENLIAKIRIVKDTEENAVSLPKSSILTDETMHNFWVMKLINDSTAVKVMITTGISENDYVQVRMPEFKDKDLFLSSGNFGLGDTANVKIIKALSHER